jgi:hypothetical protein
LSRTRRFAVLTTFATPPRRIAKPRFLAYAYTGARSRAFRLRDQTPIVEPPP